MSDSDHDSADLLAPGLVAGLPGSRIGMEESMPSDATLPATPSARFAEPLHVGRPNMGSRTAFHRFVDEIYDRRWLTNAGPLVQEFEHRIAAYLGVRNCVSTCNGTVALEIAIRALGLTGEVIVPSFTFIATAHALSWQGIRPVFADIDPETHNIDPQSVSELITPRTTGLIGVHLWGRAAPVDELIQLARARDLELLFDASHAFGATYRGKKVGGFGRAEVLSFHATKFLNTFEGGAIVTDDDELAERARLMRNFGFAGTDLVIHPGTNGKMPEVCAAMGLVNLAEIDRFVSVNARNHAAYRQELDGVAGITLLSYPAEESSNYQYVVVECTEGRRDQILADLQVHNVLARRYFWPCCHRMEPYRQADPDAGRWLPNTELIAQRVLVLPTGTAVQRRDIAAICEIIRRSPG